MQLDWGQIVTHIIGFLIAVWVVRKYAWDKLLGFIEHRREVIANSFQKIEQEKEAVAAQKQEYDQQLENIEATRREKIQEAAREAESLAANIREEARQDTVGMRDKAKKDIALELDKANVMLRDRMVEAVFTTTEKVLKTKLDREAHKTLIEDFLNEVQAD
ncbi:MAG: F0F1 ATP synthase subunit B [Candidatus Latescibacterota bacterium]|nr:MAG: F0F1 ATP synthase subunit B [Candidatus Latescibacterota bacterium]